MDLDFSFDELNQKLMDLFYQSKTSFLIGAGCSKCAGLPLMDELTTIITEEITKEDNEISLLYNDILNQYSNNINIEDILSELQDIYAILERQYNKGIKNPKYTLNDIQYVKATVEKTILNIKTIIKKKIGGNIPTLSYHRSFCDYIHKKMLAGREKTKDSIDYFILNYDNLFEDSLALENINFTDGFVGGSTAWWDPNLYNNFSPVNVYKLHGSIDWYRGLNSLPIRLRNTLSTKEIADNKEVLIYPSTKKYVESQKNPYQIMINKFRASLVENENHVLFTIGYGFNDNHINSELENGLLNSTGSLSTVILLGSETLPEVINDWITNERISKQILAITKKEIYIDGQNVYKGSKELEYYLFEKIIEILKRN